MKVFLLSLICFAGVISAEVPNVVFILADDLGWTDTDSAWYETPNLDRLRTRGIKFTDAYSPAANCAPSRACILTGQYVPRHGVYTVDSAHRFDKGVVGWGGRIMEGPDRFERWMIAPENARSIGTSGETVGSLMQRAGYKTAYLGKWHAGWGGPIPNGAYGDELRGYDEMVLSGPSHYNTVIWPTPSPALPEGIYLSDHLADNAVRFIGENKDQPFFLFYSDFLVHLPEEAPEEIVRKYEKKPPVGGHGNPKYAAMVECLDRSIGRILDRLDELELTDNTLVIFTSDNGGDMRTSNLPLRGWKGMFYEGGFRVPALVSWPGHVAPGSTSSVPVSGIDLLPTLADVAGCEMKDQPVDGQSLVPLFEGRTFAERDLFWYMPGYLPGRLPPSAVIRSGDWKLIHFFEDDHLELFNLADDIGEENDLARNCPEKAQELKARLDAWRAKTTAKIPVRNPDPKVGIMIMGGGWTAVE